MANTMKPVEVLSGKSGEVYLTLGGNRYNCMHLTEIEATIEYEKGDVPMLGKRMTGHKINGMNGAFKGKGYYRFSELKLAAEAYKNGGGAPVYEIKIINSEEGTSAGTQTVILKECTPDSEVLAKVDAGSEFLEEDIEGTFDDFSIDSAFSSSLSGYVVK